jgi:hypothetical protein
VAEEEVTPVLLPIVIVGVTAAEEELTANTPGVIVELVTDKLVGAPGSADCIVIELLVVDGVGPLLFRAVTLQDIADPTSATTVEY